jgi:hypothetical protein
MDAEGGMRFAFPPYNTTMLSEQEKAFSYYQ